MSSKLKIEASCTVIVLLPSVIVVCIFFPLYPKIPQFVSVDLMALLYLKVAFIIATKLINPIYTGILIA